jgi:hypothetical protein
MRAGDGDAEFYVLADDRVHVVDDSDDQQAFVPQTKGIDLVAGHQLLGLLCIYLKDGKERWRFVTGNRQLIRNVVNQRIASGLSL